MENADLVQHGWYVGTFVYCLVAGLLPFLSTEAFLLWLAVTAPPADVWPLLATACVAHMAAKSMVFAAGRGLVGLPRARDHAAIAAVQQRMASGQSCASLTFASALTGLPPFYWYTLVAGALRWRFARFFLAGLAGRVLRFGLVVLLPQGFDLRGAVASVGPGNLAIAALTGLLAGAHASTWGMYNDSPYEGFVLKKYLRSVVLGVGLAVVWELGLRLDLDHVATRLLLFGLTYVSERAAVEVYKVFFRNEDQSKYAIPAQLAVRGRLVESKVLRIAAAGGCVALLALLGVAVQALQRRPDWIAPGLAVPLVAALVGTLAAAAGALRKAPVSAFDALQFLPSPVLTPLWSLVVMRFSSDYRLVALSSLGFAIATLETYKTFFTRDRAPGKWARREPRHPDLVHWRRRFTPLFFGIWIVLFGHVAWAWSQSLHLVAGS